MVPIAACHVGRGNVRSVPTEAHRLIAVEYATPIIRLYDNFIVALQGGMSDASVIRLREDVT